MAGRLQLETTGPQDRFFTVEPQFTYFTKRFSRHTNFAKTFTKLDFDGVPEFGTTLRSRIPVNVGDLLKTVSFEIELEAIPNASSSGIGYIESIAHATIEYVESYSVFRVITFKFIRNKTVHKQTKRLCPNS
jgi:hypothetical protein